MSKKSRRHAGGERGESPGAVVMAAPVAAPAAELGLAAALLHDPKLRRWLPILGLIVLAFAFFSPALRGVYIWDDPQWLTESPVILEPGMYHYIWTEPQATPQYYPLVFTTFWLEYRVWKLGIAGPDGQLRGVGYHFDNLLLHSISAVLIFIILKKLKLPGGIFGAWLAAAIFAIHPVNVESVAWVVERKNCLCGVFFFASLLLGLRFFRVTVEEDPGRRKRAASRLRRFFAAPGTLYALALLLFIASMLSKTIACILPPVFLLMIWFRRGRITVREILLTLPFFAISIGLGLLTAHLEVTNSGSVGPEWQFTILQRVLIAGTSLWFYLGKLLLPYPVMQIYPRFDIVAGKTVTDVWYYVAPVAYLAVVAVLFFLRKRITRGPVTAVLFFAGVLFPALGFINYYTMIFSFAADHYQYLACIGMIVLFVETLLWAVRWTAGRLAAGKAEAAAVRARLTAAFSGVLGAGLLLALGCIAFAAANLYTDGGALWGFNLVHNPKCFVPYVNMATVKMAERPPDVKAAHDFLAAATMIAPREWRTYQALGMLYLSLKRPDQAIEFLTKAETLMPEVVRKNRAIFYAHRADALAKKGASVLERSAGTYGPHYKVADAYFKEGKLDDALREFLLDNKESPENLESIMAIARCYDIKGDFTDAESWYRRAVKLRPDLAEAWYGLGKSLLQLNQTKEGQADVFKAQAMDPTVVARDPDMTRAGAEEMRKGPRAPLLR